MSGAVVDRLARVLEHKLNRRGFLARTALGGAALSVAPVDFTLRPLDAYAQICRCNGFNCACGALCCDGYTEFCCTLYGLNRCPPGSVVAGWWKVDGSSFCGGSSRYYMDCNASCGSCGCTAAGVCAGSCSGTGCGCAFGNCNMRRAGCVEFRYGQCNQQVTCVGPIICRLVSCIPPWEIDTSCTRTVAVDEATRFHDAPCLHAARGSLDVLKFEQGTLRLQGWALDPNNPAPLQLRVFVDSQLALVASADRERPDLAQFFPGAGTNHGFDLTLPTTPGPHSVEIFGLQTYPAGDVIRLAGANVAIGAPFGSFDLVARGPGGVRVAGWLIDPNSAPGSVHIYVDGRFVQATTADQSRPDVGAAFPGFGAAHGFDVVVPIAEPGAHNICVYGFNQVQPSNSPLLGCRSLTLSPTPVGHLDLVHLVPGGARIAGWAIDPDTSAAVDIHVYVDGALAMASRADKARDDVAALHGGYGSAHGFDVTLALGPGRHEVCVYVINQGAGANIFLGCGSVNVSSIPIGALDAVQRQGNDVRVIGWALDPDVTRPIEIHVYADGVLLAAIAADRPRADIAAIYPAYGAAHGFDATIAAPQARSICVYAINVDAGTNQLLACRAPQ
ncbi:MAG TPA: twin-arginine translocation signal domain-containing protein [Acidimicrobiales bacterium]|nr:twin-arginine translocation signal domain-containing protein [Acidimicrobiales bacterium]